MELCQVSRICYFAEVELLVDQVWELSEGVRFEPTVLGSEGNAQNSATEAEALPKIRR
jgi:hypothetical protein